MVQNFMSATGFILMGSTTRARVIFGALFFYAFAMERRSAVSSLAVKAGVQAGMGKGEFSAAFANLRAIVVAMAPLLYAGVYARGRTAGSPGRPYYTAALMALIAEALHCTLRNKELQFK